MRQMAVLMICLVAFSTTGCASLMSLATNKAQEYENSKVNEKYGVRANDHPLHKIAAVLDYNNKLQQRIKEETAQQENSTAEKIRAFEIAAVTAKSVVERDRALAMVKELQLNVTEIRATGAERLKTSEEDGNNSILIILAVKAIALGGMFMKLRKTKGDKEAFQQLFHGQARALKQYMEGNGTNDLMSLLTHHRPQAHADRAKVELVKAQSLVDRRLAVNGHGKPEKKPAA